MKKDKLLALGQESDLAKKFSLLENWLRNEEILIEEYNKTINNLIKRAMKTSLPTSDHQERNCHKTVKEGEIQKFLDKLRSNLNKYLAGRDTKAAKLSKNQLDTFQNYIENYPWLRSKVNRLLVLGLRYPDKDLNKLVEKHIRENCIIEKIKYVDNAFWLMLWEDGNLVPMDAIRLMLIETDEGIKLNPCFNHQIKQDLLPLIEFQRDKEALRLQWAMSLDKTNPVKEQEISRKQNRLNAFEALLKLIKN